MDAESAARERPAAPATSPVSAGAPRSLKEHLVIVEPAQKAQEHIDLTASVANKLAARDSAEHAALSLQYVAGYIAQPLQPHCGCGCAPRTTSPAESQLEFKSADTAAAAPQLGRIATTTICDSLAHKDASCEQQSWWVGKAIIHIPQPFN